MYQPNHSPASLSGLPPQLGIGHDADEDHLLSRTSIVEYGTSSLFLTPRCDILQSGAAVAMLLRKVLGGKETRPRPVHLTLHVKDLLDHPFQVYSIVEAISSFSSVDLQFDSEDEQAIQDQRLPGAVIGFLASLGSCDEVSITPSWTTSSFNKGIQPVQKRPPAMQGFPPYLLDIKHLMEGVLSVHISGEFMATESLRNVCATLMEGEGVQSLTVDNIEQELFDKLQPCINLPALKYLRLGARAKPLVIPEQFFRRHPRLRRLCLSSCATPLSQSPSCAPPQIFPCLDHLSISTSYMPWKLKDPALAELCIEPYAIRASSAKLCSVIDSISRTLIMAINNGHSGLVSVRFPDFNGVSAEHMHTGGCSCSKTGPVSAISRLIVEATTFDLVFLTLLASWLSTFPDLRSLELQTEQGAPNEGHLIEFLMLLTCPLSNFICCLGQWKQETCGKWYLFKAPGISEQ